MTEITQLVPEPERPCKDCVEDARHLSEDMGIVWCSHVRYGGLYLAELGQWQTWGPFEDEACFRRYLFNLIQAQIKNAAH